ncbi:HEAT repeat domain-containing protein [Streptomyces lichenis]|uniref:HEAT repeat domain-containing protein n=1 Tax=Streptomyces lichenis TaxID=2306967 RepID=A0ABT0II77_9ACTN|nr:HEAT repeat domain-containing protein [Streptomyces lichenis]MCK8681035.1 HEAT repeat domain-containing protein [Streptomyces lichenis]
MLIGEVAQRSGVSARMLRHYESLGLVCPSGRTGSGYREYTDEDIRRIFHIESLRSLGLSLREAGRALDDPAFAPTQLVTDLIRQTRDRIAAQTDLLTRLTRISAAEPSDWEDVLHTVALLQALGSPSARARQRAALSAAKDTPIPPEALAEAILTESDPVVAGALRWALAHSGGPAPALLAHGLASPSPEVRQRAVQSLAELPDGTSTALLRTALPHPDPVVRAHAALALGARGVADAVPALVDLIVEGRNDTDAADALSALAADPAATDAIATALVDRLAQGTPAPTARRRLAQALADIPGGTASDALAELSQDEDRAVALTATYVLRLRESTGERTESTGERTAPPTRRPRQPPAPETHPPSG